MILDYTNDIDVTGSSNNKILKHNGTKYVASSTGNLSTTTSGVTITGGTNAVIGIGTTINIATASGTATGLLSSGDWNSFNNRWSLTGNAGTVDGTHFIGTTDNTPLNFKVDNAKAGRIGITRDASTFLGYQAGNSDDHSNNWGVGIGYQALYSNTTGDDNVALGYQALFSNTTGSYNTASGSGALYYNSTGNYNTAIGRYAGYGSTGVDFNQCTFVGYNSYPTVNRTNVTMLGANIANGQCTADHQVLLGNTAITQIRAQVTSITTYSDARYKFNIQENVPGLAFIKQLKPVTYNQNPEILHQIWSTPDSIVKNIDHSQIKQERFIGFLAQDVEKAANHCGFDFPGLEKPRNANEVYSLRYGDFIMPLVKAVQELDKKNEELIQENAELKRKLEQLNKEIEAIKAHIYMKSRD